MINCVDSRGVLGGVETGMGIAKKVVAAKAVSGQRDDKKDKKEEIEK
jgi:hypothetical protein